MTIGVEFGSRIVPVGPPASYALEGTPSQAHANGNGDSKQPQKHMKLSLWDTAGQETYKSITRSYFRGASGALLVFDISRLNTFHNCTQWLHDLRQIAEEGIVVILVGNKSDLTGGDDEVATEGSAEAADADAPGGTKSKRQVSRAQAEEWCRENDVLTYVETSAKSGEGVERAFLSVAERIYQNIEAGKYDLNDRRSGVKRFGVAGVGGPMGGPQRTVTLGMNEAMGGGKRGWGGGCC